MEPNTWEKRCADSIREQRKEIEQRYGIRIGQTEIYCARCERPWGFGRHTCSDIVFNQLHERKKEDGEILKSQKEFLLDRVKRAGAKKISTLSYDKKDEEERFIPEKVITQWIYRENIPSKYIERIETILNSLSP